MSFEPVRNGEDFWSNELIIPRSARNTFLSCLYNGLFPQQDGDWSNKISMCMRMIRNHKKFQDDNHKTQESTKKMGSSALGIVMPHPFSSAICFQVIPTWQFLAKWGTGPVFALPGGPDLCPSPVGSRWLWSNGLPGGWCVSSYIKLRQLRPGVWKKRSNTSHQRHHKSNHLVLLGLAWKRRHRQLSVMLPDVRMEFRKIYQWMEISLGIPRLNLHKWGHNPIYKYPIITPQLMLVDACSTRATVSPQPLATSCPC